jgi:hypothetical protein
MLYTYRVLVNQLYYFEEIGLSAQPSSVKVLHMVIELSFIRPEG